MSDDNAPVVVTRGPGYFFLLTLSWLALKPLLRFRVEGRERIPEGAALLVANHQSFLDIPLMACAVSGRHVCFVARDTLLDSFVSRFAIRKTGAITIKRGTADRDALRQMTAHLEGGDLVAIYPEGTRSPDGRTVGEFKKGARIIARQAKVPIVPVAIDGTGDSWPKGRSLPRFARARVAFGDPIAPDVPDALGRAREAILRLKGDVQEAAPAG